MRTKLFEIRKLYAFPIIPQKVNCQIQLGKFFILRDLQAIFVGSIQVEHPHCNNERESTHYVTVGFFA